MKLHFWSPEPLIAAALSWDPDANPEEYADGYGHNMLELYRRLAIAGDDVSLGPELPPGARTVVFLPSLLARREQLRLMRRLMRRSDFELVLIRSDFPITYSFPLVPSLEIMPNRSSILTAYQTWVPPLPQRGLRPRNPNRGTQISTLGFKGYPENLPAAVSDFEWQQRLTCIGMEWRPDLRNPETGKNTWHDFSEVDVTLCLRGDGSTVGWLRKPATKLINAWCAGTIPFVGKEPGYLELACHREDAMVLDSAAEILEALEELRCDPVLASRLRAGVHRRAQEFNPEVVLEQWRTALRAPMPAVRTRTPGGVLRTTRVAGRWGVDALHGDLDSPIWRPERSP